MEYQEYIAIKKRLQTSLLDFLSNDENTEEHFEQLISIINDQNIKDDANEFRLFLYLINTISNNHYRHKNFLLKIENIILFFKKEIKMFLSNDEIFLIFKNNRRILLFLIENDIIQMNYFISKKIKSSIDTNYKIYFAKEIESFVKIDSTIVNDQNFDHNRLVGENEKFLNQIIRDDLISDFIIYINKNDLSLQKTIKYSIYETNLFLIEKNLSLIEYSAFFGSIQIFRYLYKNNIELTPSLWLYSIHGGNPEIISILVENKIEPEDKSFKCCMIEAIKCHQTEIIEYIKTNFLKDYINYSEFISLASIENYNFLYFPNELNNMNIFYNLCKFDYYYLVKIYIMKKNVDFDFKINETIDNMVGIYTPLLISVLKNNYSITEFLLKQPNFDVNIKLSLYQWPELYEEKNLLILAIQNNNLKMVELLLSNKNIDINSILEETVCEDNTIIYKKIFPLHIAVRHNLIEIVRLLLSYQNIDIKNRFNSDIYNDIYIEGYNYSEICWPVLKGYKEIVEIFLNHPKVNVNCYHIVSTNDKKIKDTPLTLAIDYNQFEIGKLLLEHQKIDVNMPQICIFNDEITKKSPLFFAIEKKNENFVELLLSHPKIDVNLTKSIKSNNQEIYISPLNYAIKKNMPKIVKLILKHQKIDVNLQSIFKDKDSLYKKSSNLLLAIEHNNIEIFDHLLQQQKIDVNIFDFKNTKNSVKKYALLHNIIMNGNIDIIKKILNHPKININIISFNKKTKNNTIVEKNLTTSYFAIKTKKLEIIQHVISNINFDFNLKSTKTVLSSKKFYIEDKSLQQLAMLSDDIKIVQLIFDYLQTKDQINDLNYILKMAKNDEIKSIIYKYIKK